MLYSYRAANRTFVSDPISPRPILPLRKEPQILQTIKFGHCLVERLKTYRILVTTV
jgi:hypothetical protein